MRKSLLLSFAFAAATAVSGQWTAGMDDAAGKAAATSSSDLPAADFTGMRHIWEGQRVILRFDGVLFGSVELFTVPNDYIEDVVFSTTGLTGFTRLDGGNPVNHVNPVRKDPTAAECPLVVESWSLCSLWLKPNRGSRRWQ